MTELTMLQDLKDALQLITRMQWSHTDRFSGYRICQVCGGAEAYRHRSNCKVKAMIDRLTETINIQEALHEQDRQG